MPRSVGVTARIACLCAHRSRGCLRGKQRDALKGAYTQPMGSGGALYRGRAGEPVASGAMADDLFAAAAEDALSRNAPLAARLRPRALDRSAARRDGKGSVSTFSTRRTPHL